MNITTASRIPFVFITSGSSLLNRFGHQTRTLRTQRSKFLEFVDEDLERVLINPQYLSEIRYRETSDRYEVSCFLPHIAYYKDYNLLKKDNPNFLHMLQSLTNSTE